MIASMTHSRINGPMVQVALKHTGVLKSVIDLGCGAAPLVSQYHLRFEKYTGVDCSKTVVLHNAVMNRVQGNINFIQLDITDLKLIASKEFKLAWCCEVLENLGQTDLHLAFNEIKRVSDKAVIGIAGCDFNYWLKMLSMYFGVIHHSFNAEQGYLIFILDCEKI